MSRAWGPGGAPLAVLLTPVGDTEADVAGSVLALHAAGERALHALAERGATYRDEVASVLAGAADQVRDELAGMVAKIDDGEFYADLLVRDLVAEADGAMHVFDRCTAKGVPSTMAARRAGAVYGVPAKELGRYAALATEIKTHPELLAEAAEHALLGFAARIAAEEAFEPVAKALAATELREFNLDHPRDEAGRFAEAAASAPVATPVGATGTSWVDQLRSAVGLGRSAPVIAPAAEEPEPEPKVAPKIRRTRKTSRTRRTKTAPKTAAAVRADSAVVRADVVRAEAVRLQGKRLALSSPAMRKAVLEVPPDGFYPREEAGEINILVERPGQAPEYYGKLHHDVTVALSPKEAHRLFDKIREDTAAAGLDGAYLRIGYLEDLVGGNVHKFDENPMLRDEGHKYSLMVARTTMKNEQEPDPDVVDGQLLTNLTRGQLAEFWERRKLEYVRDRLGDKPNRAEFKEMYDSLQYEANEDAVGETGDWSIYQMPERDRIPVVYEFQIRDPRGVQTGGFRNTGFELDPNQIYEVVAADSMALDSDLFGAKEYSVELGAMRKTIVLRPVREAEWDDMMSELDRGGGGPLPQGSRFGGNQDKVDKALAVAELVDFDREHPRGPDGRFAAVGGGSSSPAPRADWMTALRQDVGIQARRTEAPTVPRVRRTRKTIRTRRSAPVTSPMRAGSGITRAGGVRAEVSRAEVERATVPRAGVQRLKSRTPPDPQLLIDPWGIHSVLDDETFAKTFGSSRNANPRSSRLGYWALTPRGSKLFEPGITDHDFNLVGAAVPGAVQKAVDTTISNTIGHRGWREAGPTVYYDKGGVAELDAEQGREMALYFHDHPEAEAIRIIDRAVQIGDIDHRKRTWLVNIVPFTKDFPVHIIIHDTDLDFSRPMTVEQVNEDPVRFHADPSAGFGVLPAVNPNVKIYRLRNRRNMT